jgi:hypothetical protein
MRFEEAYTDWQGRRLTQAEAARLLGACERTFRRQIDRYEADGLDGLIDKRLEQASHRRAPVDEVVKLVDLYLRKLLSHGARACLLHIDRTKDHLGVWISDMEAKGIHRNKVIVALANKLARIAWTILTRQGTFYLRQPRIL